MTNKENDAATVLTQMSQLVCAPTFDFSSYGLSSPEDDPLLDTDAIGATCTLQPSSARDGLFPTLSCDVPFESTKNIMSDPYIGFDGAEHTYAVNYSSNLIMKTPSRKDIVQNKPDEKKDFKCNYCGKVFKTRQHFNTHKNFHLNKKPHTCEKCSRSFTTKSDLKRHYKVHEKKTLFKCEKCHATFRDLASKTRHQRKSAFKCERCGKEFNRSDSYKEHMSIHENKKQFKCHICYREFGYKSSFNRHVATHENDLKNKKNPTNISCQKNKKNLKMKISIKSATKTVRNKSKTSENQKHKRKTKREENSDNKVTENSIKSPLRKINDFDEQFYESDSTEPEINEDINAIPILTSMAEIAANNQNKSLNKLDDHISITDSPVFSDLPFHSPSHIDTEVITLLDDSSTEEDCDSVISDDSDFLN